MRTVNRLEPLLHKKHEHEPKRIKPRPQEQGQGHLVRWVGIWPASTQDFYDDCIGAGRNGLYKPDIVAEFFQGPHGHSPHPYPNERTDDQTSPRTMSGCKPALSEGPR